jgi:BlaI family transcriptional regulator, penicillinase repressor
VATWTLDNYYDGSIVAAVVTTPELGPLEMEVLGLLSPGEMLSVAEVQGRLSHAGRELAYTTVMTVLVRLYDKGVVTRKKQGARFLYAPARKAPRVADGILARVGQSLFRGDRTRPILALLEDEDLSEDELRAVRDMIDERLKKEKRR